MELTVRCDAVNGVRPSGKRYSKVRLANATQCRKEGVVSYPNGPVCRGHHNHGFVSWSATIGAVTQTLDLAERMRAVVGDAA